MDSIGVARTPDHGQLWRHVLKLASGAALAQVVVLATAPLLTRYYAPDAFGVSAFFISFVAICGPIGNLNYFQAIMLPRDDAEALRLAELSLGVSLCMSVLVLGAAFVLRGLLGSPFHVPELIPYFWLFPMGIMLRSAFLVLTAWSARHRFYGAQARARVAQTVTERALSLVAGLTGLGSGVTLVFSRLASLILENAMLLSSGLAARSSLRSRAAHTGTSPSEAQRHSLGTVARNYREFPIASWTTLLANGSSQVTALLLPVLFSTEVAGLYALGNRLIQTPFMLLGESIRNVYYKELAERIATGRETRSGFVALRRHLVAAGMFPFAALLLLGRPIFAMLFGAEWERAGTFAGIIGLYVFFQFVSLPLSCVFNAYRRQKYQAIVSTLLFVNNGCSLVVGRLLGSVEIGLALVTVIGISICLVMNVLGERLVGAHHGEQFVAYGRTLLFSAPFVLALHLALRLSHSPAHIAGAGTLVTTLYYCVLYRQKVSTMLRRSLR